MGLSIGVDARRRTLLAAIAALVPCRFALASPARVVGLLGGVGHAKEMAGLMAELGYVEDRDLRFEVRAAANFRGLTRAAFELIALQPRALLAEGTAVLVLAGATQKIPIVCEGIDDPVAANLAESLRRPGRNVTGLAMGGAETAAFGLLKAMRPNVRRIAVVHSPRVDVESQMRRHAQAARQAGLDWIPAPVVGADDVERLLAPLAGEAAWLAPIYTRGLAQDAVDIAKKHRIAAVGATRGALMWYVREFSDAPRRVASILDRILKGTPPGEIPFELPDRETFTLNRSTARAIGVEVPADVMLRVTQLVD